MSSEQTDHSLQIGIQLQRLRNGCRQFIQSGDRGIYLNEKYISQIIALARTMGTELRDIELRKKYALKYHQWIKETFEDSFVREALTIKGICPGVKSEIEKALSQLAESNTNPANENNSPIGNDCDGRFVRYKEKFTKAEKWAINNSFIDESDRRWIKPKGRLATFLIILQQKSIIHTPSRNLKKNDIEKYFTDRYKLGELLGDSFKWKGKADQYEKEFSDMLLPTN